MKKQQSLNERAQISPLSRGIIYAVLILFTILTIYPLFWLFYSSFKSTGDVLRDILALPTTLHFENYYNAWTEAKMSIYIGNSFIYTFVTVVGTIILTSMLAYAFAKVENPLTKYLQPLFMVGMLITVQAVLIPLFLMKRQFEEFLKGMHLIGADSLLGEQIFLVMAYIALGIPMALFIYYQYMKGMPSSLIESAKIDGAKNFRIFWSIILPMTTPVMTTIAIITTLGTWNEFMFAFVLTSSEKTRTLSVGVQSFAGTLSVAYDRQFPALVIATLPMMLFYFIFNKKITEGMTAGAVKG